VLGVLPGAARTAAASLRGLRACGIVLLGLAPPLAFLLTTNAGAEAVLLLGGVVLMGATVWGLAILYVFLNVGRPAAPLRFPALFLVWAIVTSGIGARMFVEHVL
jgi:hypothetical protein